MFRIIPETNINFIGARRIAFVFSLALIALGIFAIVMISSGKGNLGIDFAGGAVVQGHFQNDIGIEDVRGALEPAFEDIQVTELKGLEVDHVFMIKTKGPSTQEELNERVASINTTLASSFPENVWADTLAQDMIGPAVGNQLRQDAMYAVLISLLGIIIYIWIRFDFRSGIAATIATFHDVLAVLGISYIMGMEFDLLLVTALLTLAGYSLTDTVVVYDRIRENLRKFRGRSEFVPAINRSINEVLSRTFMTSMTTLIMVLVLAIMGGVVLRDFAIALTLGVIVGTYSSVFVASPIVVEWEAISPSRFK